MWGILNEIIKGATHIGETSMQVVASRNLAGGYVASMSDNVAMVNVNRCQIGARSNVVNFLWPKNGGRETLLKIGEGLQVNKV